MTQTNPNPNIDSPDMYDEYIKKAADKLIELLKKQTSWRVNSMAGIAKDPFIDPKNIKHKLTLADGTQVTLKPGKWKKSRLGRSYNGRHRN